LVGGIALVGQAARDVAEKRRARTDAHNVERFAAADIATRGVFVGAEFLLRERERGLVHCGVVFRMGRWDEVREEKGRLRMRRNGRVKLMSGTTYCAWRKSILCRGQTSECGRDGEDESRLHFERGELIG
jgi:hypothetical protein